MTIQANFPAIKPSLMLDFANTKQLDSRITYTRASTATFYNGVTTAMAEQNLMLQSQTFDNASWTKNNSTITADAIAAPDGTTTADAFYETATTSTHIIQQSVAGITATDYIVSVYAKLGNRNFISIAFDSLQAWFNLSTGAVGTVEAGLTATILSVGSGWYRCSIKRTVTSAATKTVVLYSSTADNVVSYLGDSSLAAIYIWGAQVEQRSAVSAYTVTTTQAVTNYIPVLQTAASGVARFDNNPTTGESLGLLIEESRTNLILQSADFTTTWTTVNATVTANTVVAPDGTLTGDSIINTATSGQHYALQNVSIAANGTYTTSVYLKALGTTTAATIWLLNAATADRAVVNFTFATGAVSSGSAGGTPFTSVSATATSVGNGWSRVTLTATSTGGAINLQTRIFPNDASTFSGDAYSGVVAWGAQLEAGAFATSYIPTVASQVTRAADAASMTGTNFSSWYRQGESTIYADFVLNGQDSGHGAAVISLFYNGSTNGLLLYRNTASSTFLAYVDGTSGSLGTITVGSSYKTAFAYNGSSNGAVLNAGTVSSVGTSLSQQPIQMNIFADSGGGNKPTGTIKKLAYYPLRVTNANLQALTS